MYLFRNYLLVFNILIFFQVSIFANNRDSILVIGKVSNNPQKHYSYLKPMLNYAVSHMKDLGIKKGKVLMARDNNQMIQYLQEGKIDWITESIFSALIYQQTTNAELLVRKWKKHSPNYYTIFISKKGNDINQLTDLKGRKIVLEDPGSSTAFYVPLMEMINAGLTLEFLHSVEKKPSGNNVGYIFANSEINIATWVFKGLVDAGAYNNEDWKKVDHTPVVFRKKLNIFHKSDTLPRSIEVVRNDLPDPIKKRLKSILLNIENDPSARNVLFAYQKTKKFDEINEDITNELNRARIVLNKVHENLNSL